MHRTPGAALLSILVLFSSLVASFAPTNAEARDGRGFSERDIRGDYSVSFQGEITQGAIIGHVVALGVAHSDGNGNLRLTRTINIDGMLVLEQEGGCTYSVEQPGTGVATCTFSTIGSPDTEESYALVIVNRAEVDFVSTTPGTVVRGVGKKQRRGVF